MTRKKKIQFAAIRDDWYKSNQLMPRLARKALISNEPLVFIGFPRQWIPVFEYYGLEWTDSSEPLQYVPILSGLSEGDVLVECRSAKSHGLLRTLVESVVVLDPLLADFLYIVDNSLSSAHVKTRSYGSPSTEEKVQLTNWQSYGRPEVRRLETDIDGITSPQKTAVVLPCSRRRPYRKSRTHARIWRELREMGFDCSRVHQVVFTSLAVIPEELWENPTVMNYDAGVPDIYRLLRLGRRYFTRNCYDAVVNCLEFEPYSDVLAILAREQVIKKLVSGPDRRTRHFFLKP